MLAQHWLELGPEPHWDISGDHDIINLEDFEVLAGEWLECNTLFADLNVDGCVDMKDWFIFAGQWLAQE